MAEDNEALNAAIAQSESHNKYARTLYRTIKPLFKKHDKMFRVAMADASTYELGKLIEAERQEVETTRKRSQSAARQLQRIEKKRGIQRGGASRNPERALSAFKDLDKLLND